MFNCTLPSGTVVSVTAPSFQDRMDAVKEFRSVKESAGYSVEELMAAKSINAINSKSINMNTVLDPILVMAEWPNADVQYFIEWFMTLFFLDDKIRDKATNEAKKIMMGQSMEDASTKK